ncbi:hypothetical protein ALC62_07132 [Cyphomyrmex costatus]|uniref:Tesmin/TSO1-like CXC domain-containing protein n=1 Tax=Cyphomyrmex costatus TaxID=456900 RepID=A0A151IHZ4_9HYME|nr:hypothetical protein ALC62_07132 [Cyphomyrmex costatus]
MHKKYASRDLIDSLSYLGLCATYDETLRFEASILDDPENHVCKSECFVQYVFDNADHNTCILDGKNTMHVMGGIKVATPSSDVISKKNITRLKKIPTSEVVGKFGFIPLLHFEKKNAQGLKTVIVKDILTNDFNKPKMSIEDFTWLYSKYSNKKSNGYSGFMEEFHSNCDYKMSKIIPLPFVNNPPSDWNTIFTVLVKASVETRDKHEQTICFVTFDQPLYQKARYILSCVDPTNDEYGLMNVRVRLGGFHTLMSFLGSIGFIMDGSGLKEAFACIYADNSAEKAFTGHAYSRSIRAHFLVQVALATIIFESLELTDEQKATFDGFLQNLRKENVTDDMQNEKIVDIQRKFTEHIDDIEKKGPTAQLWIQYWNMLAVVKEFIKAERSGDWDLHLEGVKRMIPYFHASGHNNYAKSAHIYLQDIRTDKFWSGIWSDMTIEQALMRSMKTQGGLTHGRNPNRESVCTKFLLTMIILVDICNEMENFCNVSYCTSEQHVDSTESRITRDVSDLETILQFFGTYNPFPETRNIMSIFSGIVSDLKEGKKGNEAKNAINCHKAFEIGLASVKEMTGKNFGEVTFKRTNRVKALSSIHASIKVNDDLVPIDPLLLFQRLCANITEKTDMRMYLKFELAPFPLSIFTEDGFRKNTKSDLFGYFTKTEPPRGDLVHVVDGGFLLHKVVWQKNDTVQVINQKYLNFVRKHYTDDSFIVFDGYPDNKLDTNTTTSSTKTAERSRRKSTSVVPAFIVEPQTKITLSQARFLSNEKNKKELIKELSRIFRFEGYTVRQAEEDADSLIIYTAIEIAEKNKIVKTTTGVAEYKKTVVVVGQDIDLLVLLNQLNSSDASIYFLSPGAANTNDSIYSSNSFQHKDYRSIIAFLHCFSGCDTNSGFAGKGKRKIVNLLIATPELTDLVKPFYTADADPKVIARNGCNLIKSIYNCKNFNTSLDELRYQHYKKLVQTSTFKLEKIPPTTGAAIQFSKRAYFQLQKWLGNDEINATLWGWKQVIVNNQQILMPRFTEDPVIPEDLLRIISCNCGNSDCSTKSCGCRKLGLKCTEFCQSCPNDDCCSNLYEPLRILHDSEDIEVEVEIEQQMLSENLEDELLEESRDNMAFENEFSDHESNDDQPTPSKRSKLA